MFRSTENSTIQPDSDETVSADGIATPYFMLIQINNASLLEAYATLNIAPTATKISERNFPNNFSLSSAVIPQSLGKSERTFHSGEIYSEGIDPIAEVESETHGSAAEMQSLSQKIAGRFASMTSSGGDFASFIDNAMAMAKLPGVDFDPSARSTGLSIVANSTNTTSVSTDPGGALPFRGFRADYRPENAPDGPEVIFKKHLPLSSTAFFAATAKDQK